MKKIHFLMLMALATQSSFAVQNHPQEEGKNNDIQPQEVSIHYNIDPENPQRVYRGNPQEEGENDFNERDLENQLQNKEEQSKEEQSRLQGLLSNKNARLAMLAAAAVLGGVALHHYGVPQAAYEQLQQYVNTLSPETKEALKQRWNTNKDNLIKQISEAWKNFSEASQVMEDKANFLKDAAWERASDLGSALSQGLYDVGTSLGNNAGTLNTWIAKNASNAWNNAKGIGSSALGKALDFVQPALNATGAAGNEVVKTGVDYLKGEAFQDNQMSIAQNLNDWKNWFEWNK